LLRSFLRLVLRILFRLRVQGPIPGAAPERLIVIANHQSFADGLLIQAFLPFDLTWVVHSQIAAQPLFRLLLKLVPHHVVDAANPLAMKSMVQLIESGKPVAIFPEGRMTVTGSLMKVYDGLAFLAAKTGAKLLPVCIDGAVLSIFKRDIPPIPHMWRPKVTVTFFPMEPLEMPEGRTARERRRKASDKIRRGLEEMYFAADRPSTLFEALLDAIDLYGRDAPILEDIRFTPATYGELLRGALALGRLASRYTAEGEYAGVLMPNASPTVMLLFGLIAARRVPAMINFTSGVDGMRNAFLVARIKTVFTSRAFVEKAKLADKIAQLDGVRFLYLEDLRPEFGLLDKLWLILFAVRHPRRVMRPSKPDDPAVVLFTSGSEGKPKGVVLSHRNILANVRQAKAVIEFSNRDKFLTSLPMFHSFGLTAGVMVPLVSGARVFLYPSPLHYRMVPEMAYDRDCTVLCGTPTFLANYAKYAHPYDFYRVRYVLAGAEKLTENVRRVWAEKFGIRLLEGYGVTECAPVVAVNTPMQNRAGSVGKIVPGLEAKLEPVEGIAGGGILHVRGPNVMLGYLLHDQPGVIRPPSSAFGAGWYSTGDVVEIDADGFVHIKARLKRFAKVAGEMVSLELVEQIAAAAAPLKAHAATSAPNERRGEMIILFSEDPELKRDALLAAARTAGQAEVAVPRAVVHIPKLPRLGSGKVDYLALKQMAAERFPA
jgi:acyl-[acyl-carrier-protein]-phospholipid O-acyltransferase/long-chain-fatty-acid--[acyl-carrier-protein] ligase